MNIGLLNLELQIGDKIINVKGDRFYYLVTNLYNFMRFYEHLIFKTGSAINLNRISIILTQWPYTTESL